MDLALKDKKRFAAESEVRRRCRVCLLLKPSCARVPSCPLVKRCCHHGQGPLANGPFMHASQNQVLVRTTPGHRHARTLRAHTPPATHNTTHVRKHARTLPHLDARVHTSPREVCVTPGRLVHNKALLCLALPPDIPATHTSTAVFSPCTVQSNLPSVGRLGTRRLRQSAKPSVRLGRHRPTARG